MPNRSDGERLGTAVLALRTGRGEEQQALARRAGVTPAWLSKLERGLIHTPGHTTVDALAQALGFRDGNDLLRMFYGHDRFAKTRPRTRGPGRPKGPGSRAGPAVDLLTTPGCPNTPGVRRALQACLQELQIAVPVRVRQGHYPSPSVLIEGRDVMTGGAPPEPG